MIALALALAASAAAPEAHEATFERARRAERGGRWSEAVAACEGLVADWPEGPRSPACRQLVARLRARRDPDGTWTSWTALEEVRHRVRAEGPERLRPAVEALSASAHAAPAVRAEADLWLALDELERLDRPQQARDRLAAWTAPGAPDPGDPALSARLAAVLETAEQRLGTAGPERPLGPTAEDRRRAEEARRAVSGVAGAVLAAFVVAAARPAARGWRLRPRPWGLVPLGIAGIGAAALLRLRGEGGVGAALLLTAALGGVHLVSVGALIASTGVRRLALRLGAALASLAAAWLTLHLTGALPL